MLPRVSYPGRVVSAAMPGILLEGADARRFAQAQFSGDLDRLAAGHWQWNAWLDAGGRVRALLWLVDPGGGRLLALLRGGDPESVLAALRSYVLRARVRFTLQRFTGRWGPPRSGGCAGPDDNGSPALGLGARSLELEPAVTDTTPDPDAANAWCLEDIRNGWPTLPAGTSSFLPPALGLERLGAVSFAKGCYPGQEIAARLHYRGGHKLRLQHIRGEVPLAPGAVVGVAGIGPGRVLACARTDGGVAVLMVSRENTHRRISILDNAYEVVSRFDA